MLEWLKRHAWKVCKRQKRFQGSNPCLSAKTLQGFCKVFFLFLIKKTCKFAYYTFFLLLCAVLWKAWKCIE